MITANGHWVAVYDRVLGVSNQGNEPKWVKF